MNHCEFQSLLSQYMDEQLSPQTADSLKRHLSLCPQCRRELEQLTALRQLCLGLPEQDMPAGLHCKIMERARLDTPRNNLSWVRRAVVPVVAAVLVFLIGRGISDSLFNKTTTTQDSVLLEGELMALPEESESQAAAGIPADEDMRSAYTGQTCGVTQEPENSAPLLADTTSRETAAQSRVSDMSRAALGAEAKDDTGGQMERPSYLKYSIIIALVLGFGFTIIRSITKKK